MFFAKKLLLGEKWNEMHRDLIRAFKDTSLSEFITEEEKLPEIIVKEGTFDASKIKDYIPSNGTEIKKFEFKPQDFSQFIGQKEAKARAKTIIKKIKRGGIRGHFFVDGIKGHGKTVFVELVAKELGGKLITRIGREVDKTNIPDLINEINTSIEDIVILFLDEIDTMNWKDLKIFNPIIYNFQIAGKRIKPFIFAGATINKYLLIKNNPDTLERIPPSHHLKFERYDSEEIRQIIFQYKNHLYSNEFVPDFILKIISENCKFSPRNAISILEDFIIEKNIIKVMRNCKIIKNGLTEKDIEILKILSNLTRPIGAGNLAQRAKLTEREYIYEFEPFLVEYGYINRIPSRSLGEEGKEFLKNLETRDIER